MSSKKRQNTGSSKRRTLPSIRVEANYFTSDLLIARSVASPGLGRVDVEQVPLGMVDQEDLYPHLLTAVRGTKVAVPLGPCGEGFNRKYRVLPFHYQPLPQKEMHWCWWFPIHRVKLSQRVSSGDDLWEEEGLIRTVEGGGMELSCISPRGLVEWLPLPGCITGKRAGRLYRSWEFFVGNVDGDGAMSMVKFDGRDFEFWPEVM